jgi:aminoglycoside 2'-N-acetyltransferase I
MRVVTYRESEVPHELRAQMIALQDQAWPSDEPSDLGPWHDPSLDPVSLLLVDDEGRVASTADILSKDITHKGETFAASGISAMATDESRRGMGYGSRMAQAAREMMETRGADLGIFTCDSDLMRFYEGAGWTYLPGTVLIGGTPEEPFPSDQFDKVTLARFFSAKAKDAEGDFVGARIELYPGDIDKLW